MHRLLFVLLLLTGCGSDDSGGGSSVSGPHLAEFTAWVGPANLTTKLAPVYARASLEDPNADPALWGIRLTYGEGAAPACALATSTDLTSGFATVGMIAPSSALTLRACVWLKEDNTFRDEKTTAVASPAIL